MFNVERFYRPSAKDLGSGSLTYARWTQFQLSGSSATALVLTTNATPAPLDTVFLIEQVVFEWTPGAAQTPVAGRLVVQPGGSTASYVVANVQPDFTVVATLTGATVTGICIPTFSGDVLAGSGTFNAGAAANNIAIFVGGWLFPRGTLQQG